MAKRELWDVEERYLVVVVGWATVCLLEEKRWCERSQKHLLCDVNFRDEEIDESTRECETFLLVSLALDRDGIPFCVDIL